MKIQKLSTVFRNKLLKVSAIILLCAILLIFIAVNVVVRLSTTQMLKSQIQQITDGVSYHSETVFNSPNFYLSTKPDNINQEMLEQEFSMFLATNWYYIDQNGEVLFTNDETMREKNASADPELAQFAEYYTGNIREFNSVQVILPKDFQSRNWKKLVICRYGTDSFVVLKYEPEQYYHMLDDFVDSICNFESVGTGGSNLILRQDGKIISPEKGARGELHFQTESLDVTNLLSLSKDKELFLLKLNGTAFYAMYAQADGYYVVSMIPRAEVIGSLTAIMLITAVMVLLLLAVIFIRINHLTKRLIVKNIETVNNGLSEITSGNLDTEINVRDNVEFNQLSDGINATVSSLKGYIQRESERFEQELELARSIQNSAMPNVFPPFPERHDIDIFASMKPAKQVGGDFYDFFFTDDAQLVFLTADVSDKGIPAAMFMMKAKTIIKSLAQSRLSIENVISSANRILCEDNSADMFVTLWIGMLNTETGELAYINAGHCKPLLRRAGGEFDYLPGRADFVVASEEDAPYHSKSLTLKQGDALFLYTDGVTEAVNTDDALFGEEKLKNALNAERAETAGEICARAVAELSSYAQNAAQSDDITMLAVVYHGGVVREKITVDAELAKLEPVFAFIEAQFTQCGFDKDAVMEMGIIADEICSNIVFYAYPEEKGKLTVQFTFNPATEEAALVFIDNGVPFNPLNAPAPNLDNPEERREGGLGIFLVRRYSDRLQYEYTKKQNTLKIIKKRK